MMKKLIVIVCVLLSAFSVFSASYNPEGKEEFCFIPYFYNTSLWSYNSHAFSAHYGDKYIYGDFYKDIDQAINNNSLEYSRTGLWYWNYVLTKGYFDSQITTNSKGEEINDKYDYYKVVLESGEKYIYKSTKGDKYTPAGGGDFVIQPIEKYKPVIEKQSFVPGSWVKIIGCTGYGTNLLNYTLSNGAVISPTLLEKLQKAIEPIKDDSTRFKLAELASLVPSSYCNYDESQDIIWISSGDYTIAKYKKNSMYNYVGYKVSEGVLIPRIVFLFNAKNVSAIVVKYGDKEWDACSALSPSFKEIESGWIIADCWIGNCIPTIKEIINSQNVKIRIKAGEEYKSFDISEESLKSMSAILAIYEDFH